jgi:hypothetical protein
MANSAYIIGGGASLKRALNDKKLKADLEKNELIGCNRAFESFRCDSLCVHDRRFVDKFKEGLKNFKGKVFAPDNEGIRTYKDELDNLVLVPHTSNITQGIVGHNNCGAFALQLAIARGYKTIYLMGMDCRFSKDMESSHFHEGYSKIWKQKPLSVAEEATKFSHMIWGFEQIGREIKKHNIDVKVYNCSQISWVDLNQEWFPRMSIKEAVYGCSRAI